ncbi:hypothetical protein AB3N60_12315 [Leptospira sp. WS39.C2]
MVIRIIFILIFSFAIIGKSQVSLVLLEFPEVSEFLQIEKSNEDPFDEKEVALTFEVLDYFLTSFSLLSLLPLVTCFVLSKSLSIQYLRGPPLAT